MLISWFSEQPLSTYPEHEALVAHDHDHPVRKPGDNVLLFSNRYFDAAEASRLYNERIAEYVFAEEVGFDAVMTNEHHNGPFCMQARCNIMSAAIASVTNRVKILQLGNPIPLWDNPVQLAEEIAMIDLISRGRVIAGIVRGSGHEQLANNRNPAFNREMFIEGHDLIIKTWTEPGPFRWEGEHFHVRIVNPWALPLQKPHPRIFVPGVASLETIQFAASHGYPYICMNTTLETTKNIWEQYDELARLAGYEAGSEHRGYLMRIHVADTEEKAIENARQFLWMRGQFTGVGHPVWLAPAGYTSRAASRDRSAVAGLMNSSFEEQAAKGTIIAGTPSQVIEKIRLWLDATRPGTLILWGQDGKISHTDTLRCIELLGKEVIPAVREIARDLDIVDPFEADAPVSVQTAAAPVR